MRKINRRSFLKTGITGAAGVVALSPVAPFTNVSPQDRKIIYRSLGKTGIKVPVISFGVMRADNPNLCKAAYENGIRYFDTANGYQNGNNEKMLGTILKDYPRDSYILATKVAPKGIDKQGVPTDQTTGEDFIKEFEISLSRLQMSYVDILHIHGVRNPALLEHKPLLDAMRRLKEKGKVRFIGFSTHDNMASVISAAAESKMFDVILTSYNFRLDDIPDMDAALKKANDAGIGIVAMKTLTGGGFLDKERTKPVNTTAAIKWVLKNPNVHTVISGMTAFDQLDLNVKILEDISLNEHEKNDLLMAKAEQGLFCTGCNKCVKTCPVGLPIPDLMRAYMYAYGYANPVMAYQLLGELGTGSSPCSDCQSCQVNCPSRFNIKDKISDISRLVDVPPGFIV